MRHWFINHLAAYRLSGLTVPAYAAVAVKDWARAQRSGLIVGAACMLLVSCAL
jgi:hypothetical protein